MSKNKIEIPTSWDGVSISKWKKLMELGKGAENMRSEEFNIEVLSIMTGMSVEEIENLPLVTVQSLLSSISFINQPPTPDKSRIKRSYTINGKKYVVFKNLKEITTAQYIDFQSYSKDMDKNISEILAIFLIPEGHKYNEGYDIDETINDIEDNDTLGIGAVLGLMSFFGKLFLRSIQNSLAYSKKAVKKMTQTTTLTKTEMEELDKNLKTLDSFGSLL